MDEPTAPRTPAATTVDLDRHDAVLFDLDGSVARELSPPGNPAPDTFLEETLR